MCSLWLGSITVYPPAEKPISAGLIDEVLGVSGADMIYAAPSILEEMALVPESLRKLERLKGVAYGGGNTPKFSRAGKKS